MKPLFYALILSGIALFSGCSAQHPSASDGEKIIQDKIAQNSHGRIKLLSFSKVNGQAGKVLGIDVYQMQWKGEIEFLSDCAWSGDFSTTAEVATGIGAFLPQNMGKVTAKKGEKKRISGTFRFEKTEKGWRIYDGNL